MGRVDFLVIGAGIAGLSAAIRLADAGSVLVVTKEELRLAQAEYPPFGDYVCIPEQEIMRVHGTSGTTGRPTAFGIGRADWSRIAETHARVMWGMGIRPGDKIWSVDTSLLPKGSVSVDDVPSGHVSIFAAPEEIRGAVIPGGPGNIFDQLLKIL